MCRFLKQTSTCRVLTPNNVLHQFQLMLLAMESLAVERTDVFSVGPRGWRKFDQEDGHNLEDWH